MRQQTDYDIDGQTGTATLEEPDTFDGSMALAAINRAEVDIQIATAKQYPRSITAFKRTATELATLDKDTARSMYYVLPRRNEDGKPIQGPSVRLAEVVVYAWGNLRAMARIIAIDDDMVTAQGVCFDLERNVSASQEVKRSIRTKTGKRYGNDMIRVTCQAACKIAYREAVFSVVPRALFKDVYDEAQLVSVGKGETIEQSRESWLKVFEKEGVKRPDILRMLRRRGVEDITIDDIITLAGLHTSIQEGETTLAEAFADPDAPAPAKTSPLNERVAGAKKNGPGELPL